jgi:hypothetical protein
MSLILPNYNVATTTENLTIALIANNRPEIAHADPQALFKQILGFKASQVTVL